MRLATLLTASILISAAAPAQSSWSGPRSCLGGLAARLVVGHFSGSVDCRRDQLTIRRVGEIGSGNHRFAIYDYRYRLALACRFCAAHGGRRVIVLRDGVYIGEYQTDLMRAGVVHNRLILTPDDELAGSLGISRSTAIQFKAAGPPREISIGGESLDFFK